MARKAAKLAAELRSEGWRPGQDIRNTRTFECLSEACGCDTEGHAIDGGTSESGMKIALSVGHSVMSSGK